MEWKKFLRHAYHLAPQLVLSLFLITLLISTPLLADHSSLVPKANKATVRADASAILPIPLSIVVDARKAMLGKRLFEDKRLSVDGSIACVNCHYLDRGGTDRKDYSVTIDGQKRSRNTPTVFNVGIFLLSGWEGNRKSLEDVTEAIVKSKNGLANDWPAILKYLSADREYRQSFNEIYPKGIEESSVKNAMAEYLRSLITPNSKFDRFLRGDRQALSEEEARGYILFKSYGCVSCHQGIAIGANMIAPIDIFDDETHHHEKNEKPDYGRYTSTLNESDKYLFRVPSLRNIALTAPYFHDASAATLEDAVEEMGRSMLGRAIPDEEIHLIVRFLHTLTGEYQGRPL